MANTDVQLKEIEQTKGLVTFATLNETDQDLAITMSKEINIADDLSISNFGRKSQEGLKTVTGQLISGVKNQDTGPIGDIMNEALITIRGLDASNIDDEPGWWEKIRRQVKPIAKFIQQYESVSSQVTAITTRLDTGRLTLDTNVVEFNELSDSLIEYYEALKIWIAAIEYKVDSIRANELADAVKKAADTNDMLDVQAADDMGKKIEFLERKHMNLNQSLIVTIQALPAIKIVNDNNLNLIQKVDDIINHTVPLWETQMAIALGISEQRAVLELSKGVTDMNSAILKKNAELLQQTNREVREEIDRGIFDIESIEAANAIIVQTINETVEMSAASVTNRQDCILRLATCEESLKRSLLTVTKIND